MALFETFTPNGTATLNPDIQTNYQELRDAYEAATGRSISEADPEAILLRMGAYAYTVTQISIDQVGRSNLLEFASDEALDLLAVPFGVTRLNGSPSRTTLEFTGPVGSFIPQGTRVRTGDGRHIFSTDNPATIGPGGTVAVTVTALEFGVGSNGYSPGSINLLIDVIAGVTATNTETSSGGTDTESDRQLRERIPRALDRLSPGTRSGYRAAALDFDPSIVDVSVSGPEDRIAVGDPVRLGEVDVFVLTDSGLPSGALLAALLSAFNSDDSIRIVGDLINVLAPSGVAIEFEVAIAVVGSFDATQVSLEVNDAIAALVSEWSNQIGPNILVSRIVAAAMGVSGVTDAAVVFSTGSPGQLSRDEWPEILFTVTVTG